jgi:hypothetical protein
MSEDRAGDAVEAGQPMRQPVFSTGRMTHHARRVAIRIGILQTDRNSARCEVPASVAMILLAGAGDVYGWVSWSCCWAISVAKS